MIIDGIKYLTEKEISSNYGLSTHWFRKNRFRNKKLPYYKLNGKVYYNETEVADWFKINLKAQG